MTTVDGLELTVGTELPALALPPISRGTLALFAGASHDHNPVHIDLDVARAAGFDTPTGRGGGRRHRPGRSRLADAAGRGRPRP